MRRLVATTDWATRVGSAALPATVLAALLLGGCISFEPKLQLPAPPIAASWPMPETTTAVAPVDGAAGAGDASAGPVAAPDIGWRDFFGDERLEQLIALALEGNRDFRATVLNVARFRAFYDIRRADQVPSVDATVTGARQRLPSSQTGGDPRTVSSYALDVGTTAYELDLFGRVRSLSHEALEQYFASDENRIVVIGPDGGIVTRAHGTKTSVAHDILDVVVSMVTTSAADADTTKEHEPTT